MTVPQGIGSRALRLALAGALAGLASLYNEITPASSIEPTPASREAPVDKATPLADDGLRPAVQTMIVKPCVAAFAGDADSALARLKADTACTKWWRA